MTREAILVPNRSWGGEGLLGCGVGYGLLHRIPRPQDRVLPPQAADDDDDDGDDDEIMAAQPTLGRPSPPRPRGGARATSDGYEDASYGQFAESEGVQVVPVEDDFEAFVPADAYSSAGAGGQQRMMVVPAGANANGSSQWGMPRRASVVPANSELLEEDEDDN